MNSKNILLCNLKSANGNSLAVDLEFMKNIIFKSNNQQTPCQLCRRIRVLVILIMLTIGVLAARGYLPFIKNIDLTAVAADLVAIGLVITIVWKIYLEYWKPKYGETTD